MLDDRLPFSTALDAFIKRFGVSKAAYIMQLLSDQDSAEFDGKRYKRNLTKLVIEECAKVFGISSQDVLNGKARTCYESRWVAVHLIREYSNSTYADLCNYLDKPERTFTMLIPNASKHLTYQKFEKSFNKKYRQVEAAVIGFITKSKSDG